MNFYTGTRGSWFQESKEYLPLFRYAAVTCFCDSAHWHQLFDNLFFSRQAPLCLFIYPQTKLRPTRLAWKPAVRSHKCGVLCLTLTLMDHHHRIRPSIFHNRVKNWGHRFDQAIRVTVQWMHWDCDRLDYETCSFIKTIDVPSISVQICGIFMTVCIQMYMINFL